MFASCSLLFVFVPLTLHGQRCQRWCLGTATAPSYSPASFHGAREGAHVKGRPSAVGNRRVPKFHSLHRLFTQASELGPQLWDYKTSRELAEHFQISAYIIESVCGPSAPRSRSRSPRPSSTGAAASSSAVQTPVPSSVRPRLVGVEVINEYRVEDAASRLVDILNIGQGRAQDSVCLSDFNGVTNDSWSGSVRVLQDLRHHGIKVGVLSYCRSPGTIRSTREYLQALGQEVCLYLPAVIAPRPVARDCRRAGDWCKAGLLRELPPCKLCFIDDRADIVADCSRLVEPQSFRAIMPSFAIRGLCKQLSSGLCQKGVHIIWI